MSSEITVPATPQRSDKTGRNIGIVFTSMVGLFGVLLTLGGAALIGARDFASQIYDLALLRALVGVGRTMVEQALDNVQEAGALADLVASNLPISTPQKQSVLEQLEVHAGILERV